MVDGQNQLTAIVSYKILLTQNQFNSPDILVDATSTSYTFNHLEEFTTYSCYVAAVSGVGVGAFSVQVNFTTGEAGKLYCKCVDNKQCIEYQKIAVGSQHLQCACNLFNPLYPQSVKLNFGE